MKNLLKPDKQHHESEGFDSLYASWADIAVDNLSEWSTSTSRSFIWGGGLMIILIGIVVAYLFWLAPPPQAESAGMPTPTQTTGTAMPVALLPTAATEEATPTPTFVVGLPPSSWSGGASTAKQPIPTPLPGGQIIRLTPNDEAAGFVSDLSEWSYFNNPNIHVGFFNEQVYYGAMQFDLSSVPPGAQITYAALELTGLSDQNLKENGVWQVQMLDPSVDRLWSVLTYEILQRTPVEISILPQLTPADLGKDNVNFLVFGTEQLAALQQHAKNRAVSFRFDGPTTGQDNLYTWDSGYGVKERKPILWIVTDRVEYVVITLTPTPADPLTAIAQAATATQQAMRTTSTPVPAEWATPIVIVPTPSPANAATATYQSRLATAEASLFGTVTPTPLNVWTATPTWSIERGGGEGYVLVTPTPGPQNILTQVAQESVATYVALTVGTYTPVPTNWILPHIVTPMPTPGNAATAEMQQLIATAEAARHKVIWVQTLTPTPILVTPTPGLPGQATATPDPRPIPDLLVGKIAFLTDRDIVDKGEAEPAVYVMDPDGRNLARLSNRAAYDFAVQRDQFSADQRYRALVKPFFRFDGKYVEGIYYYDYYYSAELQLTRFGAGIAWDPVWSPTREQIAFVSNDTKNDDIWVINRDETGLLQLTKDANHDKRPTWSPDGNQIAFWSNRTGRGQIWVMNRDGSDQHIINYSDVYNDWNPVWVKYTDRPRDLPTPVPEGPMPYDTYD